MGEVSDYADALSLRRPSGAIIVDGAQVADTAQCVHCNAHFVMRAGSGTTRGWCRNCNGFVCGPKCAACVPFEQTLDRLHKIGHR
jgi:hypothetical protein